MFVQSKVGTVAGRSGKLKVGPEDVPGPLIRTDHISTVAQIRRVKPFAIVNKSESSSPATANLNPLTTATTHPKWTPKATAK
jgi:hypothetical protein